MRMANLTQRIELARRAAMRASETELQMCVRHVPEQEARIGRQEVLIEQLRESRSPILNDALRLLDSMQDLLSGMRIHAARLVP
jgi:hypothetical protein